jgi:hypothetical protein
MEKIQIIKNVRENFPDVSFPEPVLEPIYFDRRNTFTIEGKKLLRDKNSDIQWNIVSDKYGLIFHEEAVYLASKTLENLKTLKNNITIQLTKNKAICIVTILFKQFFEIDKSKICPRVRIFTSYDKSVPFQIEWGAVELVCENGLVVPKKVQRDSFKHLSGNLEKITVFSEKITLFIDSFYEYIEMWEKWKKIEIEESFFLYRKKELPFSEKEMDKILNLPLLNNKNISIADIPSKNATLWEINSACTQYVKEVQNENRRIELDRKIAEVMFVWEKALI